MIRTIRFVAFAALVALATSVFATDEASKNSIREVQQVLKDCGFNPGPIDGIWGKITENAATAYVRAHGTTPIADDSVLLMAQVDGHRVGDSGPCPSAGTDQASGQSRPETEVSSVVADYSQKGNPHAGKNESELIEEVRKNLDFHYQHDSTDSTIGVEVKVEVSDGKIIQIAHADYPLYTSAGLTSGGFVASYQSTIRLSEIASFSPYGDFYCRENKTCVENIHENQTFRSERFQLGVVPGIANFWIPDEQAVVALNNLIAHYDGDSKNSIDKEEIMCYEWVVLGSFHLGTWRSANGFVTRSLDVGSDTKHYSREDLLEEYMRVYKNCHTSAEFAMDAAFGAMVVVGLKVDDVEYEKKRIKEFYQNSLGLCQAEFKKRFDNYEAKMCEN